MLPEDPEGRKKGILALNEAVKRSRMEEEQAIEAKAEMERATKIQRELDNAKMARHFDKMEVVKTRIIREVRVMTSWNN